uniref:Uncharacterized protein n=1 Tax=Arundo donax TaxID=35708 RepID=A0A0A9ERH5_ARUDO
MALVNGLLQRLKGHSMWIPVLDSAMPIYGTMNKKSLRNN